MIPPRSLTTFCLLTTLACGGDPASPDRNDVSRMSFVYSGDVSGTFAADGRPTRPAPEYLAPTDYAVAVSYPSGGSRAGTVSIIANDAAGSAGGNMLLFQGVPARRATATLSASVGGLFHLALTWVPSQFRPQATYVLDAGEVTVTDYTASRIRGTFRGTAYWASPGGGLYDRARTITITGGRFDVVVDDTAATGFRCSLFAC